MTEQQQQEVMLFAASETNTMWMWLKARTKQYKTDQMPQNTNTHCTPFYRNTKPCDEMVRVKASSATYEIQMMLPMTWRHDSEQKYKLPCDVTHPPCWWSTAFGPQFTLFNYFIHLIPDHRSILKINITQWTNYQFYILMNVLKQLFLLKQFASGRPSWCKLWSAGQDLWHSWKLL